jgi:hypothetical protein
VYCSAEVKLRKATEVHGVYIDKRQWRTDMENNGDLSIEYNGKEDNGMMEHSNSCAWERGCASRAVRLRR